VDYQSELAGTPGTIQTSIAHSPSICFLPYSARGIAFNVVVESLTRLLPDGS
jgi:hypothetical protein